MLIVDCCQFYNVRKISPFVSGPFIECECWGYIDERVHRVESDRE